jgi:hypothetical protein
MLAKPSRFENTATVPARVGADSGTIGGPRRILARLRENFGRWFPRAAGRVSLLADAASRAGRQWFQCIGRCRQAFA